MKAFYTGVVKHRKLIIAVFILLMVLSFFIKELVAVNYDIHDYLPDGTHSTVSLDVMNEEFSGGIPNARVMIRDVSIPEALQFKETLLAVEGVRAVTWLDDAVDITLPMNTLDPDTVASYYQDNAALYSVTVNETDVTPVIEAIRQLAYANDGAVTGSAVSLADSSTKTIAEVPMVTGIAILFAFLVLLLTTGAWIEPVLIMIGIGVAVMINNGTNLIFGEISFVTNAAGSVLQLAVSLDYSVFLIHRFAECRKRYADPEAAMVEALCKSTSSIASSGLTTVIGFLALALMRFEIGPDLGLALAKGVAISLTTVFLFTPSLVITCYKLIDKTAHRPLIPDLSGVGHKLYRVAMPLVIVFAIVMIPAFLASNANDFYYGGTKIFAEGTEFGDDTAAIEDVFGKSDTYVLLVPNGDTATQTALSNALKSLDEVTGIISYVDMAGAEIPMDYLDPNTLSLLVGENYSRMVISVSADYEGNDTFALVEQVREIANTYYPDNYYLAGQGVSIYDLMDTITSDMLKVNLLAIGAVFLILLLTMRSVILPVILVLSIETAIWLNLAVPYFAGTPLFYIAYLIISAIQLGATVDYAILLTDRYRENRCRLDKVPAIHQTFSDVIVSILTSGSVLTVVGLLMGYICSNELLAQLGILIGRGALFSMVIVLFVLPGLLTMFDRFIRPAKQQA